MTTLLWTLAVLGNLSIPAQLMTYPDIAKALSVDGKTVACAPAIQGRAAVIRLTDRTWDNATSTLSKGLGVQAGALSRFSLTLGVGEPGISFPFLRWLTGVSSENLNRLRTRLKTDKLATLPVSDGRMTSLAEDIRVVSLQLARRDIDFIFLSLSSHPGFDSYVASSEIRITVTPEGMTSFGLGAPGAETIKAWFGPISIDWDN